MRRLALCAVIVLALAATAEAQRVRLPRAERLDAGVELRRDAATGELVMRAMRSAAPAARPPAEGEPEAGAGAIRVRVNLVEVSFNVFDAAGAHVAGLTAADVRLYEDGLEQRIVHFDAAAEPARVVLLFDRSPSVFREAGEMKDVARRLAAHLDPRDEVAVADFAGSTRLVLPFSTDRALLDRAIESVTLEQGAASERGSEIYRSVYLVAQKLFAGGGAGEAAPRGRRSILLLTDGQDTGLGLTWSPATMFPRAPDDHRLTFEDVCRALTVAGVEVRVISTMPRPRELTTEWLAARGHRPLVDHDSHQGAIPHYTLYLAELVRRAGGALYFLREMGTLAGAYQRIAESLRAQYTLGYYPSRGTREAGWRRIGIEVPGGHALRLTHRAEYYVPAGRP